MPVATPLRVTYELASARKRETVNGSDLTLGGVFLETAEKPATGALVALEIESGSTKVEVDGRVLAVRPEGFMVSFIDLPNDVAAKLQFIVTTRMPQRGTRLGLGAPEEPAPPPAPAPPAPAPAAQPVLGGEDAYAPRHPTPRMMRAAAPISSNPIPPVAIGPPSSGQLPQFPPVAYGAAPASKTSPVVLVLIVVFAVAIVGVIGAAVVMYAML